MAKSDDVGTPAESYRAPKACTDTSGAKMPYGSGSAGSNYVPDVPSIGNPGHGRAPITAGVEKGGTAKLVDSAKSGRLAGGGKTVPKMITGHVPAKAPAMNPAGSAVGSKTMNIKAPAPTKSAKTRK